MKKSNYNLFQKHNEDYILYNTITGAAMVLNKHYASFYINDIFSNCNDDKYISNMIKGGFYIEDSVNEIQYIKSISTISRSNNQILSLTIAPTLSCNFRCPYCYEKGRNYTTMTSKIVEQTCVFINNEISKLETVDNKKHVFITWYGGEPLLQQQIIKIITDNICQKNNVDLHSSIVTNGYYLTDDTARFLKSLNVYSAQVTVDGPPETHNKRRCLPNCSDTLHIILDNIYHASSYINITIRVNIDKSNMNSVDELFLYLNKYNLKNKVNLYLAAVDNINNSCNASVCINSRDFSSFEIDFYKKHLHEGYTFMYLPKFNPSICGAVTKNSYVIDPTGNLYKCWDEIGNNKYTIGNIYDGVDDKLLYRWSSYDFMFYDDCAECTFLPICMGGCPYNNISNKLQKCATIRYNYSELGKLVHLQKNFSKTQTDYS